jgi:hypothetical protein
MVTQHYYQRILCFLLFLFFAATGCVVETSTSETGEPSDSDRVIMFTLNTQEFVRTEESIETVHRVIDLHEKYNVPIDIFFNRYDCRCI